jgi:hypothetical protein
VPDALFCHKCGRPVRPLLEDDEVYTAEPEAPEPAVVADPALPEDIVILHSGPSGDLPLDFRNRIAVRCAILAAATSQLLTSLLSVTGLALMFPLVMIGGGWLASFLYRRRSGATLTLQSGAKLGWISGTFSFAITTVFFTLNVVLLVTSKEAMDAYRKSAATLGMPAEMLDEMNQLMHNPGAFVVALLFVLALLFFLHTLMSALGGAIDAYATRKREQ